MKFNMQLSPLVVNVLESSSLVLVNKKITFASVQSVVE